jgi:hypothetical protein
MYLNISLADLVRLPEFNFDNLDDCLFKLGMDVTKGYSSDVFTHRTLDSQIVTCTLYQGMERVDRSWLNNNPLASVEAVMASTDDRSLREELHSMNQRAGYLQGKE